MRLSSPKSWLNLVFEKVGYRLVKLDSSKTPIQVDMDPGFLPIYEKSKTHTMTSMDNMYALTRLSNTSPTPKYLETSLSVAFGKAGA